MSTWRTATGQKIDINSMKDEYLLSLVKKYKDRTEEGRGIACKDYEELFTEAMRRPQLRMALNDIFPIPIEDKPSIVRIPIKYRSVQDLYLTGSWTINGLFEDISSVRIFWRTTEITALTKGVVIDPLGFTLFDEFVSSASSYIRRGFYAEQRRDAADRIEW